MPKKSKWPVAVFVAKRFVRVADFLVNFRTIVLSMDKAASLFPTPKPALVDVSARLGELEDAEIKTKTRVIGAAAARDQRYDASYKDLLNLTNYVQDIANEAANAAQAIAIIEAAGLHVKFHNPQVKAPLEARNTTDEGRVDLIAKSAGRKTIYLWQMSADGKAWLDLPFTQVAKTSVEGLTAGEKIYFRLRTQNKNGLSEWSASVVIIVT